MNQQEIIQKTADYIKQEFSDDSSGHDWWHIYRVWQTALHICEHEGADKFIVQLAALLHDLDDWKFNDSDDETPRHAKGWLDSLSVDPSIRLSIIASAILRISRSDCSASIIVPPSITRGLLINHRLAV